MNDRPLLTDHARLYDSDFAAWVDLQAALIRAGETSSVDFANVAEELESLGRNEHHALRSQQKRAMEHLLKIMLFPNSGAIRGWKASLSDARFNIEQRLRASPSLKRDLEPNHDVLYPLVRERVIAKMGVADSYVPATCPFALKDVLGE